MWYMTSSLRKWIASRLKASQRDGSVCSFKHVTVRAWYWHLLRHRVFHYQRKIFSRVISIIWVCESLYRQNVLCSVPNVSNVLRCLCNLMLSKLESQEVRNASVLLFKLLSDTCTSTIGYYKRPTARCSRLSYSQFELFEKHLRISILSCSCSSSRTDI